MPLKRRWNLAETDRGSYYKEEWIDKFLDSKGAFYNSNESQWCESYNVNNVTAWVTEGVCQQLLQNSFTNSSKN